MRRPVIAVTDAAVLGAKVDGVLLVISAGNTRRDHAERAKELLEKARVRIVGVTLTNAPRTAWSAVITVEISTKNCRAWRTSSDRLQVRRRKCK